MLSKYCSIESVRWQFMTMQQTVIPSRIYTFQCRVKSFEDELGTGQTGACIHSNSYYIVSLLTTSNETVFPKLLPYYTRIFHFALCQCLLQNTLIEGTPNYLDAQKGTTCMHLSFKVWCLQRFTHICLCITAVLRFSRGTQFA